MFREMMMIERWRSMAPIVSLVSIISMGFYSFYGLYSFYGSISSMVVIPSISASALLSFHSAAQRLFCALTLFSCQKFGGMK